MNERFCLFMWYHWPCLGFCSQISVSIICSSLPVLPNFAQRVDVAVEGLTNASAANRGKDVDENEFVDASHLVYDGVREIRMAVLMNKADDELDPDDVLLDEYHTLEMRSKCKLRVPHARDEEQV